MIFCFLIPHTADGVLVVGQEQDDLGGSFSVGEAFVGQITNVEFWSPCGWIFEDAPEDLTNGHEVRDRKSVV